MTIQKKRYKAVIIDRETMEEKSFPLFNKQTAEGTSGEGVAFKEAQKIAKELYKGKRVLIEVSPVYLVAQIDIKKAVQSGALSAWTEKATKDKASEND